MRFAFFARFCSLWMPGWCLWLGKGLDVILFTSILGFATYFLGLAIPRRWIRPDGFPFRSFMWEDNGRVYRAFGVQNWKRFMPDLSRINPVAFQKSSLMGPNIERISRFILETCIAEMSHILLILLSPLMYVFTGEWPAGFWHMIVFILGNIPFVFIQRYNRPRFVQLRDRLNARAMRLSTTKVKGGVL